MSEIAKYFIPPTVAPTTEEHRAASAQWLARIGNCLYENWPDPLKAMSFRTELVKVSHADILDMLDMFDGKGPSAAPGLAAKIDIALSGGFKDGAFAKLSSRSPKDAWCESFKCSSAHEILSLFASSERILDDLIEYKYLDDACYLLLREWHEIPKHEEWRCFIRGSVIGISQYHYTEDFRSIYGNGSEIHTRIKGYLDGVMPHLPTCPVVVDVWMRDQPMVIEINPYGLSDPCLLNYEDMDRGDCGFRILGSAGDAP